MCCRCGDLVLLFVSFAARCDEFLRGGLLTYGGLAIRLPRWDAPLGPSENRLHRLRLVAMGGRLLTCAAVAYRRRSDANSGGGPIDNRPQLAKLLGMSALRSPIGMKTGGT